MGGYQAKGLVKPELSPSKDPAAKMLNISLELEPYVKIAKTILDDYPPPYRTITLVKKVAKDLKDGITVEEVRNRISNTIMSDFFAKQV